MAGLIPFFFTSIVHFSIIYSWASVAEWLRRLALKLLAPLRCGSSSNPKRGSCQLLTECFWFNPRNNVFLQLWKLTAICNQIRLENGVKHQYTVTPYTHKRLAANFFCKCFSTLTHHCSKYTVHYR